MEEKIEDLLKQIKKGTLEHISEPKMRLIEFLRDVYSSDKEAAKKEHGHD